MENIFKTYGLISLKCESRGSKSGGGSANGGTYANKEENAAFRRSMAERKTQKADVNSGLSARELRAIEEHESMSRTKPYEHLRLTDINGNSQDFVGDERGVMFNPKGAISDYYMTHNHPSSLGKRELTYRLGSSFSSADIENLANRDDGSRGAKGIRAVSETSTYSMSRTPETRNFTRQNVRDFWRMGYEDALKHFTGYDGWGSASAHYTRNAKNDSQSNQLMDRLHRMAVHKANQYVAQLFKLKYTRKFN